MNQYRIIKRGEKYVVQINDVRWNAYQNSFGGFRAAGWRDVVTVADLALARQKKQQYVNDLRDDETFIE